MLPSVRTAAGSAPEAAATRAASAAAGSVRRIRWLWVRWWSTWDGCLSHQPDAGIDVSVEDVDQEIDEHNHDAGQYDNALHEWKIPLKDTLKQQSADARPCEHHLDDDRGVHHHHQIDSRQRQYRYQRVLEAMLGDDDVAG